jgi:hypothetical protein
MTGNALIEENISAYPQKPTLRVNEYTPLGVGRLRFGELGHG